MDEIRSLKELRANKERIYADLMRVVALMCSLPTKIVRLRALDAQAMEHGDKQVGQRVIAFLIEREMLSVTEAAAREQYRQVRRDVGVGVTHVAAVKNHGAIEKIFAAFRPALQIAEELREQLHVTAVNLLELAELRWVLSVMREVVITLRDALHRRHGSGQGLAQGDEACGIALQS